MQSSPIKFTLFGEFNILTVLFGYPKINVNSTTGVLVDLGYKRNYSCKTVAVIQLLLAFEYNIKPFKLLIN